MNHSPFAFSPVAGMIDVVSKGSFVTFVNDTGPTCVFTIGATNADEKESAAGAKSEIITFVRTQQRSWKSLETSELAASLNEKEYDLRHDFWSRLMEKDGSSKSGLTVAT